MAQHDMIIDNAPGLAVRTDINAALNAVVTNYSGPTEPPTMYAGMFWLDTSIGTNGTLRMRNLANSAWVDPPAGAAAYVAKTGDTMTGNLVIDKANPLIFLEKNAVAESPSIIGRLNATARWQLILGDASPETGSNTGSIFAIARYNDAGTLLDYPFSINRSSGIVTAAGLGPKPNNLPGAVGQWAQLASATGGALILPAGGSWAWFGFYINAATGIFSGVIQATVSAGGTTILAANAGYVGMGLVWRIA
jgi:hypothetical protein